MDHGHNAVNCFARYPAVDSATIVASLVHPPHFCSSRGTGLFQRARLFVCDEILQGPDAFDGDFHHISRNHRSHTCGRAAGNQISGE